MGEQISGPPAEPRIRAVAPVESAAGHGEHTERLILARRWSE
jgi:hypothetical protein